MDWLKGLGLEVDMQCRLVVIGWESRCADENGVDAGVGKAK